MTLPVLRKIRELVQTARRCWVRSLCNHRVSPATRMPIAKCRRWQKSCGVILMASVAPNAATARAQWCGGFRPRTCSRRCAFLKMLNTAARWMRSVSWLHRRAGDADIYFVANRTDRAQDINARFRVSGKEAELWHADTGEIEPAEFSIADGRTTVPLHLAERESVFVVFRRAASSSARTLPRATVTTLATVDGPWTVSFPSNLGAPAKITLAKLESWTANADEGVKYFSGTATYTKTVQVDRRWFRPAARKSCSISARSMISPRSRSTARH